LNALARLDEYLERYALNIALGLLLAFVVVAGIVPFSVFTVRSGDVAAIWSRFGGGTVTDRVYLEGTHLKWPWNLVYFYNARTQEDTADYNALSSDGINVTAQVSFLYKIVTEDAGLLQKYVGPDYLNVVVRPVIGASLRTVMSKFNTETLYDQNRADIQQQVVDAVNSQGAGMVLAGDHMQRMIVLSNVLIRRVTLPDELQAAIDRKMVQHQTALEYTYRLDRERQEAERKRIEATGIRDFQQIVGANLTDPYLRWLGIDATLRLAQSPGSRLVIVGGKDGLPLILNPPGDAPTPSGVNLGTGPGQTNPGEPAAANLPGGNGDPAPHGALPSLPGNGMSLPFPNQPPPDATHH
jgi:prohibitin 2